MAQKFCSVVACAVALIVAGAMAPAPAAALDIVVTLKPIHSLVAGVMAGAGSPKLLMDGAASPHTFTMKPSDARALNAADLVIRVSESLEPFTVKVVAALPRKVRVLTIEKVDGLTLHALRTGDTFEAEAPDAHGNKHGHHEKDARAKGAGTDGHLWLDPANARHIVAAVASALAEVAPADADRFRDNARKLDAELATLETEIGARLAPLAGRPYVVFHDAYQYLERRYGLAPSGSVSVSPDVTPSARRITALRRKIAGLKAVCVFSEPQFQPRLVDTIIEGTPARRGTLDPLGAAIPAGPDHYFSLLRGLASNLATCLAGPA